MHNTRRKKQPRTSTAHRLGIAARILESLVKTNPQLVDREFVCTCCDVAWEGDEADCWNCGLPATFSSHRPGSALARLLATPTISHTLTRTGAAS
ncbi:hypothetical protein OHA84_37840 (plasmid) [Streptomyces sp. NBC_00513]|uniref:hypothetical protein n=1 Tax=unclassified Streptomyces TaxID=2593676 RepID=UPI0022550C0D|nr:MULTISPECIES: hypothetical protein [unclassified Streptomyces]MCX5078784.1 hypothetical protein [Streptomyces sp. NBC_00424]WUD46295.1 hypothetical protein OHA84_37840 [Streptomyces sp. NBC_00513]